MLFRICILVILSVTGYYAQCKFQHKDIYDSALDCANQNIERIPQTPPSYLLAQFIDLTKCRKLNLTNVELDKFHVVVRMDLSEIPISSQRGQVSLDIFFKVPTLKQLHFTNSALTDKEMWKLPTQLELYDVNQNEYTYIDASTCKSINTIRAENNNLKNIPIFSTPPPPIANLYLKSNPMDTLTVKSLAPLCALKLVELQLSENSLLRGKDGACECNRLNKWLQLFNISGPTLECLEISASGNCDLELSDMKSLRVPCGDANMLPDPSSSSTGWLLISIILGVLGSFIIIAGLAVFVYFFLIEENKPLDTPEPTPSAEEAVAEEIIEEVPEAEETSVGEEATVEE